MPQLYIVSEIKICQHCGSEMTRPPRTPRSFWAKRKWCDQICMAAARAPKQVKCNRCQVLFQPAMTRKRGAKFCSIQCANIGKPIKGPYRKIKDGQKVRLLHRVVKEREIGRPLLPTEIVHHRDHHKQNNSPSNLMITTNSQHSREHMMGNQNARRSHP